MWNFNYGFALVMQLLLLSSIYVIYFQSKILKGLEPQQALMKAAPADRLVIFVIDGLSAKSFYENRCRNVQELKKIFLRQGQIGISRARVPTHCKQGHVAIFAGFYEDGLASVQTSAFDTIFNRSTLSYAWGSAELLQMFPAVHKVNVHHYDVPGLDEGSYKLDEWAFDAVRQFLKLKALKLQDLQGLVLFVHLPGLQEANGLPMYRKNLNYTQREIWKTYKRFEQAFPDQRTAYLLTSNHGMPPINHHDDSSKEQVETPVLFWGAGITNNNFTRGRNFVANKSKHRVPLYVMEKIQLAPLMSALLGLPTPVNNRGQMPLDLLNVSKRYESHTMYINALQLLDQAQLHLQRHGRGLLTRFIPSHWMNMQQLDSFEHSGNLLWYQNRFLTLKEYSGNFMPVLLQCIEYYESYYRRILLMTTAFGFLGWLHYLRCESGNCTRNPSLQLLIGKAVIRILLLLLLFFVLLQRVSWLNSYLLLLPGLIWTLALNAHEKCERIFSCKKVVCSMLLASCCIAGFYDRRIIALFYLSFVCCNNREAFLNRSYTSTVWLLLVCALTSLTWLPPSLGYWQNSLLQVSLLLTFLRPIVCRTLPRRDLLCNGLVLLTAALYVLYSPNPWMLSLLARVYLCYVFYPRFSQSVDLILYNLSTLYALLSTSYEALVLQMLAMELQLQLRLKADYGTDIKTKRTLMMYLILYSYYSFFVVGDLEAIDRFNFYMRCSEIGYYSSFINALIIALKVLLPVLLMQCIIFAHTELAWLNRRKIFQGLLFICNCMAIFFLFRVRNEGYSSWQVSVRIVHFATVQAFPFILFLLGYLTHFLLGNNATPLELPKWNVHQF